MTTETHTETTPTYPLAHDASGNPLDVPPDAVGWRVRKLARRAGRPKVLFDAETGRPLELPLTTSYDDFVEQVNEAGRFRLEAIDDHGRIIPGCVAVTEVVLDEEDDTQPMPRNAAEALPHLHQLIAHLVDANTQVMKAMASAFGHVQPHTVRLDSLPTGAPGPVGSANQTLEAINQIGATVNQIVDTFTTHKNRTAPGGATPSTTQVG